MRTFTRNQYEFESSSSEESVLIATAAKASGEFRDAAAFLYSARTLLGESSSTGPSHAVPFRRYDHERMFRSYLADFAQVRLPDECDWPTFILAEDWCEHEALIEGPDAYYFIRWETTA